LRIAIDVDSTLHHYWDQFAAAAKRRFGVDLPYENQMWQIDALRPEQVKACVEETHKDEHILAAEPYPGAVETIAAWHAAGHYIHITTHRRAGAQEATARWLERIGLPYDELYCSDDKISRCREIGIDLLIDDSPINMQAALEQGIKVATIVHPWNEDLCETEDVFCAGDWPQLARKLAPLVSGEQHRVA
jgi:uncharacterized HAD superfamily protein